MSPRTDGIRVDIVPMFPGAAFALIAGWPAVCFGDGLLEFFGGTSTRR